MKKILSLVLVIALVLGSFSFAFAAGHAPDVDGTVYEESVEVLMALGVVNGYPDGEYKPERVVTRAEMAKLLVEALGYGQLASGTAPYSDTAGHWAQGSIAIASGIGLVQGYPDGTFKPDASVSFDEAVTMILRALGYTDESLRGSWPTNYKIKAIDLGLYDGTTTQTGGANRGNVAIMLFNALDLTYGTVSTNNVWVVNVDGLKLIDRIGALQEAQTIMYGDVFGANALDTVVDLEQYLYAKVDYYLNADDEVALVSKVYTKAFTSTVVTTTGITTTLELEDGTTTTDFVVTSQTAVYFNGTETTLNSLVTASKIAVDDQVTVVYTEANGIKTATGLKIWKSTDILANAYVANATQLTGTTPIQLPKLTDGKVNAAAVTVEGDASVLSEIKKDDVVHAYVSDTMVNSAPEKVKLVVVRDTVAGKVTEVSSDGKTVVIGGVTLSNPKYPTVNIALNSDVIVALDKDGDIFATLTASAGPSNYALVKATQAAIGFTSPAKVQVVLANGETVVYDLASGVNMPTVGQIVDLTLNTNGVVTAADPILAYDFTGAMTFNATTGVLGGNKLVNDDTVIFYLNGTTYSTLEASELGANITASGLLVGTSVYVDVLYVTDKGTPAVATNVYAVMKSYTNVLEGTNTVQRITHYLDAAYPVLTYTASDISGQIVFNTLVQVDINAAGRITAISAPPAQGTEDMQVKITTATTVTAIAGNLIQFNGGDFHTIASDVVVYTLNADGTSVTGVGSISDINVNQAGQVLEAYKIGTTAANATVKYIFIKPAL